jgi:hypothetical protein
MPSIFVWKADEPTTSKKQIRYYSGSNWALEDNDYSSKSYMFLEQIVIPGFNDSVITFHTKLMPQDWTGSELLEVTNLSYEQIKSDNYGILEKLGDWMRFTSKNEIKFDSESLQNELLNIKKWMTEKKYATESEAYKSEAHKSEAHKSEAHKSEAHKSEAPRQNKFVQKPIHHHHQHNSPHHLSSENVQLNFQEFLIKYNMPLPTPESLISISTSSKSSTYNNGYYKKGNTNMGKPYSNNRYHNTK